MRNSVHTGATTVEMEICPYCFAKTSINPPINFAPVFAFCDVCNARFIVERHSDGLEVMTEEEAPCYSNPDCIELEMGGCDEE